MLHSLFSVYDKKAQTYSPPFLCSTKLEAIRTFRGACSEKCIYSDFPQDFTLMYLADFDRDLGVITPCSDPLPICEAIDFAPSVGQEAAASAPIATSIA